MDGEAQRPLPLKAFQCLVRRRHFLRIGSDLSQERLLADFLESLCRQNNVESIATSRSNDDNYSYPDIVCIWVRKSFYGKPARDSVRFSDITGLGP